MSYTRRAFGKLALTGLPAAMLLERPWFGSVLAQARPNSLVNGVQLGVITYSYRQLPDQSAEATLRYVVDSGISAIELMGGPAESFAGAPQMAGGGFGRGSRSGGPGGGRGPGDPAGAAGELPPGAIMIGGQPCVPGQRPEGGPEAAGRRGGGGRGRGQLSPEQQAAQREAAEQLKQWRLSVSMDRYKALRKMYNDAGVTIYAWKALNPNMSDDEYEYVFNVAEALGCTHTTLELPTDVAQLKRVGAFAEKKKIYAAYHTHTQGNMTAFDQAFAVSKANMANVDFGHYVAGGGGDPIPFLTKFHSRIASFHMKDRQTPANGAGNLPWGQGDTPLKEILQTVKKNRWTMPASIELEYEVPAGSDAVKEVARCRQFCRSALT